MKTVLFLSLICACLFSQTISSQNVSHEEYRKYVSNKYKNEFRNHYNKRKNVLQIDGVIHIFINEHGNFIETGLPTTSTENDKFKFHLITTSDKQDIYVLDIEGKYEPTLNIENKKDSSNTANFSSNFIEYEFATYGPYTSEFTFTITKKHDSDSTKNEVVITKTVNVAKLYHVTISTGLFMTTLKNPTNIREGTNANGEPTLLADDKDTRGLVALNAVFYPLGRSFLFPPSGKNIFSPERFGILVGTQLDKDQFENFIGGIQFDFARGGSIAFGCHYGKRSTIIGHDDFEFGEAVFEGDISTDVVKDWNIGFFIGANLDLRIFGQLFNVSN